MSTGNGDEAWQRKTGTEKESKTFRHTVITDDSLVAKEVFNLICGFCRGIQDLPAVVVKEDLTDRFTFGVSVQLWTI